MKPDYSRAHVDGAEDLYQLIANSGIDFNSPRIWGNILRYMVVCQNIESIAWHTGKKVIRILDVGCSDATLFGFIKHNFKFQEAKKIEYVGVDVRASALQNAKDKYGNEIELVQMDLNDSTLCERFNEQEFDVISAQQVLEHIGEEDAIQMIKSCHKLLSQFGRLILSAPNPRKHLGEQFISTKTTGEFSQHMHVYEFTFHEIAKILDEQGFAIHSHLGALTRAMPWDVEYSNDEQEQIGNKLHGFGYGFFVAMFSTIFASKSKNYLIIADKDNK